MSRFSFVRAAPLLGMTALALLGPAIAAAQEETETAAEAPASADPIVHAILVEAVAEYDAAHYAEAQALFRRAGELAPTGRTFRGLGMASYELRQYAAAIRALESSLVQTARPLTDAQRAHVEDLLAHARTFVAPVRFTPQPSDATLRIDGAVTTLDDAPVLLDPGRHLVVVERDGYDGETLDLVLEPGVARSLAISLTVRPTSPPPPRPPPSHDLAWVGAGLGALAALGLASSATTGILAITSRDQLAIECDGFVCPSSARDLRDRARDLSIVTDVTGSLAALVGTVAIVLLLVDGFAQPPAIDASAICTGDGCALSVRGAF